MPARRSSVRTVSASSWAAMRREGVVQPRAARRRLVARATRGSRRRRPRRPAPRATACPSRSGGPAGSSSAGRTRSAGQLRRGARGGRGDAQVRAEELVRRAEQHVERRARRRRGGGAARSARRRPRRARRRRARGRRCARRVGHRAERVRGQREGHDLRCAGQIAPPARRGRACRPPCRSGTVRTVELVVGARSAATATTFASWSSCVTTISSPGASVRPTACASRKLSVVMFGPNAISSAVRADEVGRGRARAPRPPRSDSCARARTAPPRLAFERSR